MESEAQMTVSLRCESGKNKSLMFNCKPLLIKELYLTCEKTDKTVLINVNSFQSDLINKGKHCGYIIQCKGD